MKSEISNEKCRKIFSKASEVINTLEEVVEDLNSLKKANSFSMPFLLFKLKKRQISSEELLEKVDFAKEVVREFEEVIYENEKEIDETKVRFYLNIIFYDVISKNVWENKIEDAIASLKLTIDYIMKILKNVKGDVL